MDCALQVLNDAIIVQVSGRVDEATWIEFGETLSGAVKEVHNAKLGTVVIDLSKLDYMSSRGLRVLTVAKREADESGIAIELASPNAVMREILSISRYDKLFAVRDNVNSKT